MSRTIKQVIWSKYLNLDKVFRLTIASWRRYNPSLLEDCSGSRFGTMDSHDHLLILVFQLSLPSFCCCKLIVKHVIIFMGFHHHPFQRIIKSLLRTALVFIKILSVTLVCRWKVSAFLFACRFVKIQQSTKNDNM